MTYRIAAWRGLYRTPASFALACGDFDEEAPGLRQKMLIPAAGHLLGGFHHTSPVDHGDGDVRLGTAAGPVTSAA
jgi:hypothetical protein